MDNQKNKVATDFIINFYVNVDNLTHHFSQYINFLLEVEYSNDTTELLNMEDAQKEAFNELLQSIRYYINRLYIDYRILNQKVLKEEEDKALAKVKEEIDKNYVIERVDIEEFLLLLKSFLVKDVMKDLLTTSQDIYSKIYDEK